MYLPKIKTSEEFPYGGKNIRKARVLAECRAQKKWIKGICRAKKTA